MGSGSIGYLNTENFKQIADIQMTMSLIKVPCLQLQTLLGAKSQLWL